MGLVQNNIEESIEQYNNSLLQELGKFSQEYESYANIINRLFYYYIQNCLRSNDEIYLDGDEVYNVLELVEFLKKLKYKSELSTNE